MPWSTEKLKKIYVVCNRNRLLIVRYAIAGARPPRRTTATYAGGRLMDRSRRPRRDERGMSGRRGSAAAAGVVVVANGSVPFRADASHHASNVLTILA